MYNTINPRRTQKRLLLGIISLLLGSMTAWGSTKPANMVSMAKCFDSNTKPSRLVFVNGAWVRDYTKLDNITKALCNNNAFFSVWSQDGFLNPNIMFGGLKSLGTYTGEEIDTLLHNNHKKALLDANKMTDEEHAAAQKAWQEGNVYFLNDNGKLVSENKARYYLQKSKPIIPLPKQKGNNNNIQNNDDNSNDNNKTSKINPPNTANTNNIKSRNTNNKPIIPLPKQKHNNNNILNNDDNSNDNLNTPLLSNQGNTIPNKDDNKTSKVNPPNTANTNNIKSRNTNNKPIIPLPKQKRNNNNIQNNDDNSNDNLNMPLLSNQGNTIPNKDNLQDNKSGNTSTSEASNVQDKQDNITNDNTNQDTPLLNRQNNNNLPKDHRGGVNLSLSESKSKT